MNNFTTAYMTAMEQRLNAPKSATKQACRISWLN